LFEHKLEPGISFDRIVIDGDEFAEAEEVFVRFDAVGSSNAHTVVLMQDGKVPRWFTIEVLALTGQIRFHEGEYVREEVDDADFE
ncbi:MAG: hypothetical protein R3F34_15235, partial [Planctomycetota bacterium]